MSKPSSRMGYDSSPLSYAVIGTCRFRLIIAASLLLMAGCQTVEPVVTTTEPQATAPSQSSTPSPAFTPTTLSPSATPTRARPTAAPTTSPLETASGVFAGFTIDLQRLQSPGQGRCTWERLAAFPKTEEAIEKYGIHFYTRLEVKCFREEEVAWVLVDHWLEVGLGYPLPELLGWSNDEQTLYFFDKVIPDGCPPPGGFQENLRRVDMATGEIETVPVELGNGISLSPDTNRIAFTRLSEPAVHIYDFQTGEERSIPFNAPEDPNGWFVGNFAWSPAGQSLLINIQIGDACFPAGSSIQRIDLAAGEARTLVEQEGWLIAAVKWNEVDRALISINGDEWLLDTETGELESPSPTEENIRPSPAYFFFPWDDETGCIKPPVAPVELAVSFSPFCFYWSDTVTGEKGYQFSLEYSEAGAVYDTFVFRTAADVEKLRIPDEFAPRLNADLDECRKRKSFTLKLYAILPEEERYLAEMAFEGECSGSGLPHSPKGYELYSWQENEAWIFTLITGTNRKKTVEELTGPGDQVTEDGWVKITVKGVEAVKDLLSRLPRGENILWAGAAGMGPAPAGGNAFALPPEELVEAIREHCQEYLLNLTVLEE